MNEAVATFHDAPPEAAGETLLRLPETERARLGEALQELLVHGSILGLDSGQIGLYTWCRQNFEHLREIAALLSLDVALLHEERMVQAIPRAASMVLRLRQDATLVWLALWYAGDVRWRDEGEAQAFVTVADLITLLKDQLLPEVAGQISRGRFREILRQAERFDLIRFEPAEPFEESGIEVLPAIRRVVPFSGLAAWTEAAARFQQSPTEDSPSSASPAEEAEV